MDLTFSIRWQLAKIDKEVDPRLLELLAVIEKSGSLQAAADEQGLSYRTAWQIVDFWNRQFKTPLCYKSRGRGTRLSPLGEKLVDTRRRIDTGFAKTLKQSAQTLNDEIQHLIGTKPERNKLAAYTSHDLAVGFFKSLCEQSKDLEIDFVSRGSLDALKQLSLSEQVITGFHFPEGRLAEELASDYLPLLDDDRYCYIQLARRQQGLMFRSASKGHIKGVADLTRRSIRFINRQKGSGTRAIFDHLLAMNELKGKDINGYQCEEFTHTAVAAMVSSNHADVGFGLKAAAAEFKLSFLPVLEENYIIAFNRALPKAVQKELRALLKSTTLHKQINKLPGYDAALTGKRIHASKLLGTE